MAKYKLINNQNGDVDTIHDQENSLFIPPDPANTDYQEYLEWVAEGNEPEPADE